VEDDQIGRAFGDAFIAASLDPTICASASPPRSRVCVMSPAMSYSSST
jgi:hypothetical protein